MYGMSHNWCVIIQNAHNSHLSRYHFVHTFGRSLKTTCVGRILAYYIPTVTTWLLQETLLFDLRAACELLMVNYVSKLASCSLSSPTFTNNF